MLLIVIFIPFNAVALNTWSLDGHNTWLTNTRSTKLLFQKTSIKSKYIDNSSCQISKIIFSKVSWTQGDNKMLKLSDIGFKGSKITPLMSFISNIRTVIWINRISTESNHLISSKLVMQNFIKNDLIVWLLMVLVWAHTHT